MTTALAPVAPMVAKLVRLLASNQDGEVVASARALRRVLHNVGLDLNDLAQMIIEVPPARSDQRTADQDLDWRGMVRACAEYLDLLPERERAFVRSMVGWRGEPSEKQQAWLKGIYERLHR